VLVAIPDAPAGHGLRFELGPPRYSEGELRVGGRGEWGDLAFSTVAARARVADTVAGLRRRSPWLRSGLGSDLVYVAAWAVFNAALVVLVVQAAGAATRAPR